MKQQWDNTIRTVRHQPCLTGNLWLLTRNHSRWCSRCARLGHNKLDYFLTLTICHNYTLIALVTGIWALSVHHGDGAGVVWARSSWDDAHWWGHIANLHLLHLVPVHNHNRHLITVSLYYKINYYQIMVLSETYRWTEWVICQDNLLTSSCGHHDRLWSNTWSALSRLAIFILRCCGFL